MKGPKLSSHVHLRPESLEGSHGGLMVKVPKLKSWPEGETREFRGGGGTFWFPKRSEFVVELRVTCSMSKWVVA